MGEVEVKDMLVSGYRPLVVASITDPHVVSEANKYADIIETRVDLNDFSLDGARSMVRKVKDGSLKPVLITIRRAQDGGNWYKQLNGDEEERLEVFRSLYDLADLVDIEADSKIATQVIEEARKNDLKILVSHHNFFSTEDIDKIRERIEQMEEIDADMLKLAYYVNGFGDTVNLFGTLLWYYKGRNAKAKPLSVIGMGSGGLYTRFLFPLFGSSLTYGYVENGETPKAPGQPSVRLLRNFLDKFSKYGRLTPNIPYIRKMLDEVVNEAEQVLVTIE